MPPVAGFATEVHECQNEDVIFFDGVKDAVRETANQKPANILLDASPTIRGFQNALNSSFHLHREICTQSGGALFIIQRNIRVFSQCVRMVDKLHRPTNFLTRAEPSSPGMPAMEPERISSRRLRAKLSQACLEGLCSSSERLPASLSTRSARSFAGNSRA